MRTILFTIAAFVAVCSPALAGQPYFGVRGGFVETQLDNSREKQSEMKGTVSLFTGIRSWVTRIEAEYTYRETGTYKQQKLEHTSQSLMGNLYFDPPVRSKIRPYLQVGAGITNHHFKKSTHGHCDKGDNDDQTFTWSVGAGFGSEISHNVFFDLGYRFIHLGDPTVHNKKYKTVANEGYAGLRFHF